MVSTFAFPLITGHHMVTHMNHHMDRHMDHHTGHHLDLYTGLRQTFTVTHRAINATEIVSWIISMAHTNAIVKADTVETIAHIITFQVSF
ncbi:unnamed protein product [Clavelina lepadiformis]|uniref:Uncharacterized protein n=1 Tax=Clavelina lepadiformis TaxID=159417 RepID=A0ABP0GH38_CLALP